MRVNGRIAFLVKMLLSLGLIAAVIQVVDFKRAINVFVRLDPWYLLAAVVLICLDRILMAYKWNLLLRALDVRVPFRYVLQTYSVAPLSGLFLPSTVAGDLFRLYSLSRFRPNNQAVVASMVVERVMGFLRYWLSPSQPSGWYSICQA
jgi:uncharacterized protein (TIRG00374 family)